MSDLVAATSPIVLDDLFVTEPVYEVPSTADRYRYKKIGGSSDTSHTYDSIE